MSTPFPLSYAEEQRLLTEPLGGPERQRELLEQACREAAAIDRESFLRRLERMQELLDRHAKARSFRAAGRPE